MNESDTRQIASMQVRLIKLNLASEAGFRIAAESVKNRGLKALLKAHAAQRAQFADELSNFTATTPAAGMSVSHYLGSFHRGWILIKAALTIGPHSTENVVLKEVQRGDAYALRRYQQALAQSSPEAFVQLLQKQYQTITEVAQQVDDMVGNQDSRLVVRLFDNDDGVQLARRALEDMGIAAADIRTIVFNPLHSPYTARQQRQSNQEAALAGGLLGAAAGVLVGLLTGLMMAVIPEGDMTIASSLLGTVTILAGFGAVVGLLFGGIFGLLIGSGTTDLDAHLYAQSVEQGQILMLVCSDQNQARLVADLMHQVNLTQAAS